VLFVWLLGCQPLTDGICDDVLDVIEGIAGETVIELIQEENNMLSHEKSIMRIGHYLLDTRKQGIIYKPDKSKGL
jgi:hypothetical protein